MFVRVLMGVGSQHRDVYVVVSCQPMAVKEFKRNSWISPQKSLHQALFLPKTLERPENQPTSLVGGERLGLE
jgi:hypothetical protein